MSPSAPRQLGATLGLSAALLPPLVYLDLQGGGTLASLPRWQSASSTPTRAGRRLLLDLSGGPPDNSAAPPALFYISSPRDLPGLLRANSIHDMATFLC
jgi:hypothetical protein